MKRADEVLARRRVDRRLAADRAVHLREQRRRDLNKPAAALQDRRRKANEIADHTAA
jgi:hypothetical protein